MHIGKVFVHRNRHKCRTRQIARLIYYYCCVRYMKRNKDGRWVTVDELWQEYCRSIRGDEA